MAAKERWRELVEYAWTGLSESELVDWISPFDMMTQDDKENPDIYLLSLMRRPENFAFTAKLLFDIDLLPYQCVMLQELWKRPFPILLASRGAGKTWTMALYAILRATFLQGRKIVMVAAGFRQSKNFMSYVEDLWHRSVLLQDIMSGSPLPSGPRHDTDRWTMRVGYSTIVALPLGTGERIRGERANDTIIDEFSAIANVDIIERVIGGFSVVSSSPAEKVKHGARIEKMKELGLLSEERITETDSFRIKNQQIISGTAYYSFNHFAKYHAKWKKIIESKGDVSKLQEVFTNEEGVLEIPEGFDWRDYSVIRIPVTLLPKHYMDMAQVARAKATMDTGLYSMEYLCFEKNTLVITDIGVKKIIDIKIGDKVLTHAGRFKKVTGKTQRYAQNIMEYNAYGYNRSIKVTKNHPYWVGNDNFDTIENINECKLTNLKELSGLMEIDLTTILSKFLMTGDGLKIYPESSQSKISFVQQQEIRKSNLSISELAKQYKCNYYTISNIKFKHRYPKNAIPYKIPLDYNFGLIIGYYAAEGSGNIANKDKACSFSLDEHNNTQYIAQLKLAIKTVFGLNAREYNNTENATMLTINSRLVANLMKYICPGDCYTKYVKPNILFSNPEFMRGFIEGAWNGDGSISKSSRVATYASTSSSLSSQLRVCLSYFNISASFFHKTPPAYTIIQGRKITNLAHVYMLQCGGYNFDKICKLININIERVDKSRNFVLNQDGATVTLIKNKTISKYNDYVYNLEVEDDNSYSILGATVHNCLHSDDSKGFFRASLINSCVANPENIERWKQFGMTDMEFVGSLRGKQGHKYVMGVDTASERDNFAIVILELHETHRRVVHCWTFNRAKHKKLVEDGLCEETDFYGYCARKIRDLMGAFPVEYIAMDAQGGGLAVSEALHSAHNMKEGEQPIWPIIEEKEQDTDNYPGLHIIHMIQFANSQWTKEANHGMKKDFEDKKLIFPIFDSVALIELQEGLYDTTEECMMEIEEIKNELVTIVHTQTANGTERWDTPEIKISGSKKGRQLKDRYSALLMANAVARGIDGIKPRPIYTDGLGGFVGGRGSAQSGPMYSGPEWFTKQINENNYGFVGSV